VNKSLFVASLVAPVALIASTLSASAQTDPRSILEPSIEASNAQAVTFAAPTLDMSMRMHDDWPLVSFNVSNAADLSMPMHDDWPLASFASKTSLDLSPRVHDNWARESR
jgi:hypothetical protein